MALDIIIERLKKTEDLNIYDYKIIDENNVIIIIKHGNDDYYILTHAKMIDGHLVKQYSWTQDNYDKDIDINTALIKDKKLLLVQGKESFDSVYNYDKNKFVIRKGKFEKVEKINWNMPINYDFLSIDVDKKSDLFIGSFKIKDDEYFAILNKKGFIKRNIVFKGNCKNIEAITSLYNYRSLAAFKTVLEYDNNYEDDIKKH